MPCIRFIGDVHASFNQYVEMTKEAEISIQVGDFGLGFQTKEDPVPFLTQDHRFLRGNHDDPAQCEKHPNWIKDGHYDEELEIFFLGGAKSIDKNQRTPGVDWWENEELSMPELYAIVDSYSKIKPQIMVTHDCPDIALHDFKIYREKSRTAQFLNHLCEIHRPHLWVFGHHHKAIEKLIGSTLFIGLDTLKFKDINF